MLFDQIKIQGQHTRAVNIERDSDASQYILTDNALSRLQDIAKNMLVPKAPRAWNLVGPYGSGKSAFALYVSALLGARGQKAKKHALDVWKSRSPDIADYFKITNNKKGFCPLLVVGAPEPMAPRIVSRLHESLADFGIKDNITPSLKSKTKKHSVSSVVDMLCRATDAIATQGGEGLLIMIDEMGKFLEYDAYHPDSDNAFLLQALAELTLNRKKDESNILLFSIMHKGYGDYLRSPDAIAEWRKVEGRFEQLSFIESSEHMLRLVERMFDCKTDLQKHPKTKQTINDSARLLWESGIFADQTLSHFAEDLFNRCYPLHPVSALLLATLSEKIGQNERTMFAYIGGTPAHSFSDTTSKLAEGQFVMPWNLYDYFLSGGLPLSADSALRRMWAAVEDAMQRLGENSSPPLVKMLKTIALFNLCGVRRKFAASPMLLSSVFENKQEATRTLKELEKQSYVTFRKFSGDYRIWEGSDFDLDGAVSEEISQGGIFSVVDALNQSHIVPPIVAHKHAIITGNLRRIQPFFIDKNTWQQEVKKRQENRALSAPQLFVYLASADEKISKQILESMNLAFTKTDCLVISRSSEELKNVLCEGRALRAVLQKRKELLGDAVAAREAKTRMAQVSRAEHALMRSLLIDGNSTMHWRGKEYKIVNRRALQNIVSVVMDEVYSASPHVFNELINRDKPSAQAIGARNKLLAAVKQNATKKDLGIEKYPPEKGIYLSLLHKTKLHRRDNKGWRMHLPTKDNDPFNFMPVWERLQKFLDNNGKTARAFSDLDSELQAPPFGIKSGMLPLFYALFILSDERISFFEDGKFAPNFTLPHLERFLAQPHTFTFRQFDMAGKSMPVFSAMEKIFDAGRKRKSGDILSVVRPLIKFIHDLPPYSQNTQKISEKAQAFCKAVLSAKSPHDMFLFDIPKALGFSTEEAIKAKGDDKMLAIRQAMDELQNAYPDLLLHFEKLLVDSCGLDGSNKTIIAIQEKMVSRLIGLDKYCMKGDELLGFFRCVREDITADNKEGTAGHIWLKRVLLVLSGKNSEKWEDADFAVSERKLAEYMRRIADLEKLRGWESPLNSLALVRIVSAQGERESMVSLAATDKKARQKIESILGNLSGEKRRALLVNMLESELAEDDDSAVKERNDDKKLSIA